MIQSGSVKSRVLTVVGGNHSASKLDFQCPAYVYCTHSEAVSLLVDVEPDSLKQTKSIVEAAKNSRTSYSINSNFNKM